MEGDMTRILVHAALIAATLSGSALADERVLLLSAYSPEQAVLLRAAGVDGPEDQVGVFNGHRFFAGKIGVHDVVLGLTGIGLIDAHNTTAAALAWFHDHGITPKAIVFSGVAGGPNIGDVVVPDRWTDGEGLYPVDACMFSTAQGESDVPLNPFLPVEDVACTGRTTAPPTTPVRTETDPQLVVGGLGSSSDPFNGRAVPCVGPPGPSLLGCEACGAPINTSPDPIGTVEGVVPFLDPTFYTDLLSYFSSPSDPGGETPVVGDMETAAVAKLAAENHIPFLAFRAVSDGGGDPLVASALIGFPVQFLIYQQLAADNAGAVVSEFFDRWRSPWAIVSPLVAALRFGEQQQFAADVSCPPGAAVVWSVQEAGAGTIDANGLYTAPPHPTAVRSAHVVATSTTDGRVLGVAEVILRARR
jgi:nucleoside phosphorylase